MELATGVVHFARAAFFGAKSAGCPPPRDPTARRERDPGAIMANAALTEIRHEAVAWLPEPYRAAAAVLIDLGCVCALTGAITKARGRDRNKPGTFYGHTQAVSSLDAFAKFKAGRYWWGPECGTELAEVLVGHVLAKKNLILVSMLDVEFAVARAHDLTLRMPSSWVLPCETLHAWLNGLRDE